MARKAKPVFDGLVEDRQGNRIAVFFEPLEGVISQKTIREVRMAKIFSSHGDSHCERELRKAEDAFERFGSFDL